MSAFTQGPETIGANILSVAGPQASVAREFHVYPDLDDVHHMIEAGYNVIIIDLDSNPEQALDLIEHICIRNSAITVMVYSAQADHDLLVRCMRAGAREFLTLPLSQNTVAEALVRASVRRPAVAQTKKALGRLFVFTGAKGGTGVTTIASNFAIALACESRQNTLL